MTREGSAAKSGIDRSATNFSARCRSLGPHVKSSHLINSIFTTSGHPNHLRYPRKNSQNAHLKPITNQSQTTPFTVASMSALGFFLLFLLILLPLAYLAYILYARISAQRSGRPPPPFSAFIPFLNKRKPQSYSSSSSPGILRTIRDKLSSVTHSKQAGAYSQPLSSSRGQRLDPDGVWDTRVDNEADAYGSGGYHEEQEFGLRSGGGYGGHGTELPDYGDEEMGRGRSVSRDIPRGGEFIGGDQRGLDRRFEEVVGGEEDPFGDDQAEKSELGGGSKGMRDKRGGGVVGGSPTERRSMFRENM
ncbi:MAG: hypothetical protein Q9170_007656 [Blastenia crenularia]